LAHFKRVSFEKKSNFELNMQRKTRNTA
jgi:hypothetical protein